MLPPRIRSARIALLLLGCCAVASCDGGAGSATPAPPVDAGDDAAAFDLSHWKLTLPVDVTGASSGDPQEIRPDALMAGYQSPWFFRAADGALVFWAPVNGAVTDNAKYARSELRELIDGYDERRNWGPWELAELQAQLRIDRVPAGTGKVVIGQIHAFQGSPLVKLRYHYRSERNSGRLDALVNLQPGTSVPLSLPLISDLTLGEVFSYSIRVDNGVLTVQSPEGQDQQIALDPAWLGERFYFKLGSYVQDRGTNAADGAQVRFYSFATTHAS